MLWELPPVPVAVHVHRMLFAGGTVAALAAAAGSDAVDAAAQWQAHCAPLWAAVASVALAVTAAPASSGLAGCVKPAVEAADAWAAETGTAACKRSERDVILDSRLILYRF